MKYKNKLKESLMSEEITDSFSRQNFKLSYEYFETEVELEDKKGIKEPNSNLEEMSEQNIRDYISSKYIEKDEIEMEKLIKDLIIFKAYKCEVEIRLDSSRVSLGFYASHFAIFAALLSVNFEISDIVRTIIIVFLFYYMTKNLRDYIEQDNVDDINYSILRSLNYAISILEAIKEDIYAKPEKVLETKEFNFEVSNSDECIEPNIYSVKVKESLEDKS